MSIEDLTPNNFIERIKLMDKAERGKISAKKLIELIVQCPDKPDDDMRIENMQLLIQGMKNSLDHVIDTSNRNKDDIADLQSKNRGLIQDNNKLREDVDDLNHKIENYENLLEADNEYKQKFDDLQNQIHEIEQYLRVNNIEMVGLPPPNAENGETDESIIVNALNTLVGLPKPIRPEDIDISHPLKSQRRDNKPVHVVRFISRKVKNAVLTAKRAEANRQFKFRNGDVYVNEHLNKKNRSLFAAAQERKRPMNIKYVWTKSGVVHMRKTDDSEVVTINSAEDFQKLL